MSWSIITDSSCDYVAEKTQSENISIAKVPFIISIGEKDYVDDEKLNVAEMIDDMEAFPEASHTSCPSPGSWYELFEKSDNAIAITISSSLSGSYNSAMTAKEMILEDYPDKQIFVLDSKSAGSALAMYVEKASSLIKANDDFDFVVSELIKYREKSNTAFALASFGNLVKNGRMSKLAGFIAGKLGIWGLGVASNEGTIVLKAKMRGLQNVVSGFINDMKENGFNGGDVTISHCQNSELAERLNNDIKAIWSNVQVKILAVGGLCSYYAERRGLIVAY